jgi:hypothetical protein
MSEQSGALLELRGKLEHLSCPHIETPQKCDPEVLVTTKNSRIRFAAEARSCRPDELLLSRLAAELVPKREPRRRTEPRQKLERLDKLRKRIRMREHLVLRIRDLAVEPLRAERANEEPTRQGQALLRACDRISSCGQALPPVWDCQQHGMFRQTIRCKHPMCPWCSAQRRGRLLHKYVDALTCYTDRSGAPRTIMLTLTQPTKRGESVRIAWARLRKHLARFRARLRSQFNQEHDWEIGGLSNLEATPRPDRTWHAHCHMLLACPTKKLENDWTHPKAGTDWRPLNPWKLRAAWAVSQLDRRTREGKLQAELLEELAENGAEWWAGKLDRGRSSEERSSARLIEAAFLTSVWAPACRAAGVPAVLDVRPVHPSEGVKYVTKGFSSCEGMTDWHLIDLASSLHRARRADAWGSLYRMKQELEQLELPEDQSEASCPVCQGEVRAVLPEYVRARSAEVHLDWFLAARAPP